MKKSVKILSVIVVLCLILGASVSCGGGETMMSLADKTLSVNVYELLLSRMKGTLYSYGYDVNNESFWKTVISTDGMTYDDYFSITIMEEASRYLIADYLFDRNGLIMTEEREAKVDRLLSAMVKSAGSKTKLNEKLKEYGVNYDMLRGVYILEEKTDMLKDHLYGNEGEKIEKDVKEAYLAENYVAFCQIFLASYYYLTDLDAFGDTVYYTDEKHTAISYDKVNGRCENDEFGKTVTDIFGDPVYYGEDGKIAYDKEAGVVGYVTDENGDKAVAYYGDEKKGELFDLAARYAEECNGDIDRFKEYAELYDESESHGERTYLYVSTGYYGSQSEALAYLDEIAEGLYEMKTGECRAAQSDFGFHVFCKLDIEKGAYDNEDCKDAFSDFHANLIDKLFDEECAKYESAIEINPDAVDKAPTMASVGTNILY